MGGEIRELHDGMEAASRRLFETEEKDRVQTLATFFAPDAPITIMKASEATKLALV